MKGEAAVRRKRVGFTAEKTVKTPTEVEFTTGDGIHVDFRAKKPVRKRVRVSFLAKRSPKR